MDLLLVEYRDIEGFPLYRVGSDGTIWSKNSPTGKPCSEWRLLKCKRHSKGYRQVHLFGEHGKVAVRFVHHLVLEAFVGPRPCGMEACHFPNLNRDCNCLTNLRWGTSKENSADSDKHGTISWGEQNNLAKLTVPEVESIRHEFADGESIDSLGLKYGVTGKNIEFIVTGRTWKRAAGPVFDRTAMLSR